MHADHARTGCREFPEDGDELPLRVQYQTPQQRVPGTARCTTRPVQDSREVCAPVVTRERASLRGPTGTAGNQYSESFFSFAGCELITIVLIALKTKRCCAQLLLKLVYVSPCIPALPLQVSTEDLTKYNALAQQQAKKLFPTLNMSKFYAAENADPLVFCHFAENIQDQIYDQVGISLLRGFKPVLQQGSSHHLKVSTTLYIFVFSPCRKGGRWPGAWGLSTDRCFCLVGVFVNVP